MYVSFIGSRLTKTRPTLTSTYKSEFINMVYIYTKCQLGHYACGCVHI